MRYLSLLLAALMSSSALAQTSEYQFPKGFTRVDGNNITFCVNEEAPLVGLEEEIARMIARTMGTNAKFYPYNRYRSGGRVMGMQRREFVILLTDHCDVFMGLPRSTTATFDYPADEQQLSTRPYMVMEFVFVSRNPDYKSLRDLPAGTPVLFEHASLPTMLISKVRPDLERMHAVATTGSLALLDRFERGDAEVMIVWAPALFERYPNPEETDFEVYPISDLPNMDWLIVGGIASERTGLRTQIDQAIIRLIENGDIQGLLAAYELPSTYFSAAPVEYSAVEGDDDFDDEELEGIDFGDYGYEVDTESTDDD